MVTFSSSVVSGAIVARNSSGAILANDPTEDNHVSNKKYVDDAIAGLSGGGGSSVDLSNYIQKSAFNSSYGIKITNGYAMSVPATAAQVKAKTNKYAPLMSTVVDDIVIAGLTDNKTDLTSAQQYKAREWLGISDTIKLYRHEIKDVNDMGLGEDNPTFYYTCYSMRSTEYTNASDIRDDFNKGIITTMYYNEVGKMCRVLNLMGVDIVFQFGDKLTDSSSIMLQDTATITDNIIDE